MKLRAEDITVRSYVHGPKGLVAMEDLTEEQRNRVKVELMVRYMNERFAGQATFRAPEGYGG